jgi:hypothetical protein
MWGPWRSRSLRAVLYLGCYSTARQANRSAKAEARELHRSVQDWINNDPEGAYSGGCCGATVWLYDDANDIASVYIFVEKISCQRIYESKFVSDEEDDSDDRDSTEDERRMKILGNIPFRRLQLLCGCRPRLLLKPQCLRLLLSR